MSLEVELRSFINQDQYTAIAKILKNQGWDGKTYRQATIYFDSGTDTRIEIMKSRGSIRQKQGFIHDVHREEIEIELSREKVEILLKMLREMNIALKAIWFRERGKFSWRNFNIYLDNTIGYKKILEVEKIVNNQEEISEVKKMIKKFMKELGASPTPKDVQDKAYNQYLRQWKEVTKDLTLSWIDR